ncbi:MAG TPA: saccharopine dehydrogenase C-terminal domain-containing protein [Gemmatimonadales bacterium]|jgi:lysine 6-dehydrogenase|nr:saccharopine dehydrogenase C-terminal domain-containing protein [Gemmatimonadales bacterium]
MRMLVLGAGLQGSACAYDLLQRPDVERVTLADLHPGRAAAFLKKKKAKRLVTARLDAKRSPQLRKLMRGHDAVMNALPYYFNYPVSKAAVAMGLHCADLGGNTEIVQKQKTLHAAAQKKRVSVIPDCGLAPGMVNIIAAEGIRRVGDAESVKIFVGGLPQQPEPPLNYQIVYSLEGALDYYTTPSWVLREGRPERVDALSELESVEFPSPVGTLEAFHTGGGISTMPWAYRGKVRTMEYKTLRYPGHVAIMRPIRELGLLALDPVKVKGVEIVPRDAFIAAVSPRLTKPNSHDLVALRVEVRGRDGRRVAWQLLDYYDEATGISAMMRTTGFSLAITGVMQVDGRIPSAGVYTPDEAVPFQAYVEELMRRGVEIREVTA